MSRVRAAMNKPVEFLGVDNISYFEYGDDHALGYFIQGYDAGCKLLMDRDKMGMGLCYTDRGREDPADTG